MITAFKLLKHVIPILIMVGNRPNGRRISDSDQFTVAVVDLMLYDLRCKALKRRCMPMEQLILVFYNDALISLRLPQAGQGQTSFLGIIGAGFGRDLRIDHDHLHRPVTEYDDAFSFTDHVSRHTDAFVQIGPQGIQQVDHDLTISLSCWVGLLRKK